MNFIVAFLISSSTFDAVLIYFFDFDTHYALFRSMLVFTPLIFLIKARFNVLYLNPAMIFFGFFVFFNACFIYINVYQGIGYLIGIIFIFINIFFMYNCKEKLNIFIISKYCVFILLPIFIFDFYLLFNSSFYSWKGQFFGLFANANINGMFLVFFFSLIALSRKVLNNFFVLIIILIFVVLLAMTVSRSSMVATIPLFVIFFRDLSLGKKVILILFFSFFLIFIEVNFNFFELIYLRFLEGDSRQYSEMILSIVDSGYLPNGPNSFHDFMTSIQVVSDNSYFELMYNLGWFSLFLLTPFLYIFVFQKCIFLSLFILPLLIQSFFERMLSTSISPLFFLNILVICVFYSQIKASEEIGVRRSKS